MTTIKRKPASLACGLLLALGVVACASSDPKLRMLQDDELASYRPPGLRSEHTWAQAEHAGSAFSKPQDTNLLRALRFANDASRDHAAAEVLRVAKRNGWGVTSTSPLEQMVRLGRPCGDWECGLSTYPGSEPDELVLNFDVHEPNEMTDRADEAEALAADPLATYVLRRGRLVLDQRLDPADAHRMHADEDLYVVLRIFAFHSLRERDAAVGQTLAVAHRSGWRGGRKLIQSGGDSLASTPTNGQFGASCAPL